jgi:hypothetical protein
MARTRSVRLKPILLLPFAVLAGCGESDPTDPGEVTVTGINLAAESNPVALPGTVQVTATVSPPGASQAVTWASSDPDVATVDASGVVTTRLVGTAVITATSVANPEVSNSIALGIECPDPRLVTSNITGDATWENWVPDPVCFDYVVQTSLSTSAGTLVIEPGTVVGFEEDLGLRVRSDAGLLAEGTADDPIVLTGTTPERGFWRGVALEGRTYAEHVIRYTTIEYAGGSSISQTQAANLMVTPDVTVRLEHSTFQEAEGYGLFLGSGAEVVGDGENRLTSNSLGAAYVFGSEAEHLKPGGDLLLGNDVDVVMVHPNRIDNEATWPRATYHVIRENPQSFNIFGVLTLTPGTEVRIQGDQAVIVHNSGGLVAVGTAGDPILITGSEAVPGHWRGLAFTGSDHPDNALDWVTLEYGGGGSIGTGSDRANLILTFAGSGTISRVRIANSTFRHSPEYGIYANRASELVDFTGNHLTQNALGPVSMDAPVVADLDSFNDFTGNGVDEITVNVGTGMGLEEPTTWIDPGVPYFLKQTNSAVWVIPGQPFTLEPGVEMLFGPGVGLSLGTGSSLTAEGTEINRISLRAKTTKWLGLDFQGATGSLDYVDIQDGGSSAWGTVGAPGHISIRVGFMSAPALVNLGDNVTFSGGGFNLAFAPGNTVATGCVAPVHIPSLSQLSDHCK